MNEPQLIGYIVMALITIGGFITVIIKMTQPLNELKLVIQELKDWIQVLKSDSLSQNKRIEKHGQEIDELRRDFDKLETRVNMYHNHDK